jgi:hypothetical protein
LTCQATRFASTIPSVDPSTQGEPTTLAAKKKRLEAAWSPGACATTLLTGGLQRLSAHMGEERVFAGLRNVDPQLAEQLAGGGGGGALTIPVGTPPLGPVKHEGLQRRSPKAPAMSPVAGKISLAQLPTDELSLL